MVQVSCSWLSKNSIFRSRTVYFSLESLSMTCSTFGSQPLSSPMLLPLAAPPESEKLSKSKTLSKMSNSKKSIHGLKPSARTHSQLENENYNVNHLRLHPRLLHNVPNLSIALQINSGTFVSVMPQ